MQALCTSLQGPTPSTPSTQPPTPTTPGQQGGDQGEEVEESEDEGGFASGRVASVVGLPSEELLQSLQEHATTLLSLKVR